MGVVTLAVRLIIPAGSRRGRLFRRSLDRLRKHRAINYANQRYNLNRQSYYDHAVVMKPSDEAKKISVIVPCFNTPKKYFEPLLASLFAQGYGNWEMILVDASSDRHSSRYLEARARADTRIKYIRANNEGIAINTNKGIKEATGELIAFLDHDDTLDPDALAEAAALFAKQPHLGLVYSDEDKISDDGERYFEPHFKPDFSLDMLRNVNYITHFVVVKKAVVDNVKGLRAGFDGAQDYEFLLRVVDSAAEAGHIPKVLYHWRQAEGSTAADFSNKQHVTDAGCRALQDHYSRRKLGNLKVQAIENRPGFYRAKYQLDDSKRRILLDFSSLNLLPAEKEYILDHYRNNGSVVKNNIEIVEAKADVPSDHDLVVRGAFIPAHQATDLTGLFGLAEEKGVSGVSPKIVRHGRIFDLGIVKVGNTRKHLFRGLNPNRPLGFGSVEWVRNVDELTGNVGIYTGRKQDGAGRHVIWSHSEFVAFSSVRLVGEAAKTPGYYNPNLCELTEIIEESDDHITDLIKVKK